VANNANFDAEIRLDIGPFIASIQTAQSEVAKLSGQIDQLNKKTLTVKTNVSKSNTGADSGSKARIDASKQEIAMQKQLDAAAQKKYKAESAALTRVAKEKEQEHKAELKRIAAEQKAKQAEVAQRDRVSAKSEWQAEQMRVKSRDASIKDHNNASKIYDQEFAMREREGKQFSSQLKAQMQENQKLQQQKENAALSAERGLARERYALYDVAAAYTVVAGAAGAAVRLIAGTAIDYERSFANVQRTTENFFTSAKLGEAARSAKNDLKSLASEIPVAFGQITEIATIGNQLGIAQGAIKSFTETVAKFSAATGVSVESTAMAFGRIGELLNVPATQFENLGSSIAFAGVNAVATEEQILSVTKEIATTAKMAKFTTAEVVGLSTALSSLGIAPEAARGSIIRTFAGINKAVSENGERLRQYADIAGMPAEVFASTWNENGQVAFDSFLSGLQKLSDQGENLDTVLRNIGMVNVRDIQAIQKLGDNYSVYASSIQDANKGFSEGTFLADAYGVTQDTVAAKLALVSNNIANLLDTLGQSVVGDAFKSILDAINQLLVRLNYFAKSPVGQVFGGLIVVVGSLVAIIGAINAASAIAQASLRAFATAQIALIGTTSVATAQVGKMNGALIATGTAGKTAALGLQKGKIALNALNTAFKAVKIFLVISAITTALDALGQAFTSAEQKAENLFGGFSGLQDALSADYANALSQYGSDAAVGLALASGEIRGQTIDLESNNEEIRKAVELQNGLAVLTGGELTDGIKSATDEVRSQNLVLGENFNAWIATSIASSDAFKNFASDTKTMDALKTIGFNLQDAIDIVASGGNIPDYISALGDKALQSGKLTQGAALQLAFYIAQARLGFGPFKDLQNAISGSVAEAALLGAILPGALTTSNDAAGDLNDTISNTSRTIRTVVDYANDLRTVFARAFEIRYGRREALDDIAEGWQSIADSAKKAEDAIASAEDQNENLQDDRKLLEYQLEIALRYKDEEKAARIRKKIADIDKKIADNQDSIASNQDIVNRSTEGNTEAAIENRSALRGQLTSYAALVEMYAKTGLKGNALKRKINELKEEFRQQGLQAGYSNEQLLPYLATFDDMRVAVDQVPRDVDIEFNANLSPAQQALREFIAQANASSATVTITTNQHTNHTSSGNPPATAPSPAVLGSATNPYTTGIQWGQSVPAGTKTLTVPNNAYVKMPVGLYMHGLSKSGNNLLLRYGPEKNNINGVAHAIKGNLVKVNNSYVGNINALKNFAQGGYISGPGTATSDSIPAMLSDGEYVIKASSVNKFGEGFLDSINRGELPKFRAGGKVNRVDTSSLSGIMSASSGQGRLKELFKRQKSPKRSKSNPDKDRLLSAAGFVKDYVFDPTNPLDYALAFVPGGIPARATASSSKAAAKALKNSRKTKAASQANKNTPSLKNFIDFKRNPNPKVLSDPVQIGVLDGYVKNAAHTLFGTNTWNRSQIDNIIKSNSLGIRKGSPMVRVANESDAETLKLLKPGQAVTLDRFMSVTSASSKEFIEGMAKGSVQTGGRRGGSNYPIYKFNVKSDIPGIEDINKIIPSQASNVVDGLLARGQNMKLTRITTDKKTGQQIYHFDIGKGIRAKTGFEQLAGRKSNKDMISGLLREGRPDLTKTYRKNIPGLGGFQNRSEWMPRYYAKGGLAKGTDTVPAMLTPGEYVMNSGAVGAYGVDFMNAINQQKVNNFSAGQGRVNQESSNSGVVYLSDQDRILLMKAINRPISLYTTDKTIAQSANAGNKELARRGTR
jgi:TP901 family phage tail tape measure protein